MKFLFYTIALNFVVLAVSADYSSSIENGQSTNDFKPRTAEKVYNTCGSACPPTCVKPDPGNCILSCKADYFCPDGYLENSVGQCVLKEDCDVQPTPDTAPLHRPFPFYPGQRRPRPFPRPIPRSQPQPIRPFPISFPGPQNLTEVSDDFVRYPDLSGFQPYEPPQFNLYPSLPQPSFQISPVEYNATAAANGAPSQPIAVVRTTGSNLPYISRPALPKVEPVIDLDPTVLRPALRISREQSSEDDKQ